MKVGDLGLRFRCRSELILTQFCRLFEQARISKVNLMQANFPKLQHSNLKIFEGNLKNFFFKNEFPISCMNRGKIQTKTIIQQSLKQKKCLFILISSYNLCINLDQYYHFSVESTKTFKQKSYNFTDFFLFNPQFFHSYRQAQTKAHFSACC